MDPRIHFARFARYGVWATRRLFEHVDALPEEHYRRDAGLFFRSIHGTLNHLLVAEHLIWYPRFAEGISPSRRLDEQPEPDRQRLRERLIEDSRRWEPLVSGWSDERYAGTLEFTSTLGVPRSLPFAATLAHVFNHGTHHRGQITAAITAMGHPCPEIDLAWMLAEEPAR